MSYPSLKERIRLSAVKFPEHTALSEPALYNSSGRTISYNDLSLAAESFATFLATHSIGPGKRVAMIIPKSIDAVVTMIACLYSNTTCIPIDPELPAERIKLLLRDADPHALVAHPDYFPAETPCRQQFMSSGKISSVNASVTFLPAGDHSPEDNIAAILYTSGSTGLPKGVCLSDENISSFVQWGLETFNVNEHDHFSSIAPLHFDLSTFDIWTALSAGGRISLFDHRIIKNAKMLSLLLAQERITVTYATPSLLGTLVNFGDLQRNDHSKMRLVLFAGEIFPVKILHQLMNTWNRAKFFNLYGPTETNVCSHFEIPRPVDTKRTEPWPIGKICNQLDHKISEEMELLISGPNVAKGYWKRNDLSETVFVNIDGKIYYHTGDRVEKDAAGNFVFTGRLDRMIKRRGYRVEPGEIENIICSMNSVIECAVKGEPGNDGMNILAAYIVTENEKKSSFMEVKQFCAQQLPAYMIPDKIVFMNTLPKTSSGKIDYGHL
ncbi:MAG: amino acid adenylation domain-containing protein [Bacteroidetes bacterium]|nr:amino acid adenylation domain-containing protein [Bacteroidota bacterium]